MKLEITDQTTKTYEIHQEGIEEGFRLDITDNGKVYDAFLYHKQYGTKSLMFGCPKEQQSYDDFLEIVRCNILEYIPDYITEHMDDEI
jgi:hypothetical protein